MTRNLLYGIVKLQMKKLTFITSAIISFLTPVRALAQSPGVVNIIPPSQGFKSITNFISNALVIALALGILVVLVMLILGAFEWITSGGDKEAVGKARSRILNALIGLVVLAIAYALARLAAQFVGFDIGNITIPAPNTSPAPSGQF